MAEQEKTVPMNLEVPESLLRNLEFLRTVLNEPLMPFYIDTLKKGAAVKEIEGVLEQHVTVTDSESGKQITLFEFMEGEELYINSNLPPQIRPLKRPKNG